MRGQLVTPLSARILRLIINCTFSLATAYIELYP